jgi:hypothetical protein
MEGVFYVRIWKGVDADATGASGVTTRPIAAYNLNFAATGIYAGQPEPYRATVTQTSNAPAFACASEYLFFQIAPDYLVQDPAGSVIAYRG